MYCVHVCVVCIVLCVCGHVNVCRCVDVCCMHVRYVYVCVRARVQLHAYARQLTSTCVVRVTPLFM